MNFRQDFTLSFDTLVGDDGLTVRLTMKKAGDQFGAAAFHHHLIPYTELAGAGLGANALIKGVKGNLMRLAANQVFSGD